MVATDSGWYARKMGQQPQQQAPQYQQAPPQYAPTAFQQQAPQVPQQYVQQQQAAPQSFAEAIQAVNTGQLPTYGGQATRTETVGCPACGSNHYFSRRNAGQVTTQKGMATPAPQCYSCGYNGLFEQADAATWNAAGASA